MHVYSARVRAINCNVIFLRCFYLGSACLLLRLLRFVAIGCCVWMSALPMRSPLLKMRSLGGYQDEIARCDDGGVLFLTLCVFWRRDSSYPLGRGVMRALVPLDCLVKRYARCVLWLFSLAWSGGMCTLIFLHLLGRACRVLRALASFACMVEAGYALCTLDIGWPWRAAIG